MGLPAVGQIAGPLSPRYRFSIDGLDVGGVDETTSGSRSALFTAFPDYRQRIERIVVDGDILVVEAVADGEAAGNGLPAGTRLHLPYVENPALRTRGARGRPFSTTTVSTSPAASGRPWDR